MTNRITTGDTVEVVDTQLNRNSTVWRRRIGERLVVEAVSSLNSVRIAGLPRGGWSMERFKKVTPVRPADEVVVGQYIIILRNDQGVLLPAVNPKVYLTDVEAKRIGSVMAKKHGGTFQVFKAICEYDMPKVTTPTFRAL
jgi:hypothetical protein